MTDEIKTTAITECAWNGLAGALRFEDGTPPWYYEFSDGVVVCAALESVEVHHYGDPHLDSAGWQFARTPLTSYMGRILAEATIASIERMGLVGAMKYLGFERVV